MASPKSEAWLVRSLERSFLVGGVAMLLAGCGKHHDVSSGCCNDTEWTTSLEVAKAYATKDAKDVLSCPSKIQGQSTPPPNLPPDAGQAPWGGHDLLETQTQTLRTNGDATSCVYRDRQCCPGGRPLYEGEGVVVAKRSRGGKWSKKLGPLGTSLDPAARAAVARGWLDDAFAEHASVASFARATIELMALGAPPALLAAHQRASLQEIRHAERCFALARAYGGDAIDPGPLAAPLPRAGGLARLAADLLVEGCIAETIGALLATRALETCTVEPVRDVLTMIANDEAAHAALAWKTLAWAVVEGGDEVIAAVLARARRVDVEGAPSPDLRAHGRLSDAEIAQTTRDAWTLVIDPMLAKLQALQACKA